MVSQLLSVHTDMRKNAVLQFMLEIIAKTNEELHKDEIIYQFLKNSLIKLDQQEEFLGLVPLHFLSEYLKFSGWFPDLDLWEEGKVFRMEDGRFEFPSQEISNKELSLELSQLMYLVFSSRVMEDERIISSKNRKDLFNALLLYFEIHLMKGKKIKSPECFYFKV